jgi:DNA (cytosine-5)-methyltransferase 1
VRGFFTALELCAGGGGQALGIEQAGFCHAAAVEIDPDACTTLKRNRPSWEVIEADIRTFDASPFSGVDLVAAGVPCPPFSLAGKQLGADDERDLFPAALEIIATTAPRAILLENVRGLAGTRFDAYRKDLFHRLQALGYLTDARLLNASNFGVPQLRPRYVIIGLRQPDFLRFAWPVESTSVTTVGDAVGDLMGSNGWPGAGAWRARAGRIAPTIVGGSKKHGGPDLGPTRARAQWAELGIDGLGIGAEPPGPATPIDHKPKLTLRMAARIQGFPDSWLFAGGKTSAYRQIGNAFPPPVARAIGVQLRKAFEHAGEKRELAAAQPYLLEGRVPYEPAATSE